MKIRKSGATTVLRDRVWGRQLLLLSLGAITVWFGVDGVRQGHGGPIWSPVLGLCIGGLALLMFGAGLTLRRSIIVVDGEDRSVLITRVGLFGRSRRRLGFEDIEAVEVITREGSEGTDYAVEIRLCDGGREEVGMGGFISRQKARDVAAAIEERL